MLCHWSLVLQILLLKVAFKICSLYTVGNVDKCMLHVLLELHALEQPC
jgi:hypothetical protein